jgi:hypothetical protein
MERSLGNLTTTAFAEIWESEAARALRAEVATCPRTCWMIGSAAEPIKRRRWQVLRWVADYKWRGRCYVPPAGEERCATPGE